MENRSKNVVDPVITSPSRTPLSENPTLLPGVGEHACSKTERKWGDRPSSFQTKARALFADTGILKRGENWWSGTPNRPSTTTKARQYLHGTPPRTRKNAGRPLSLNSHTEASGSDLALSTLHTRQPSEHFVLEQDVDFWKDHNVQVLIRIRPLSSAETAANGMSTCLRQESSHALTWLGQPESRFTFDHVACASTTQEDLFRVVGLPMVDNCIQGYNSSMFAYGQTGSGKTYTMLGEIEAVNHNFNPNCGITPRIFEYLFTKIDKEEAAHREKHLAFSCKCSFLEIYNEQITDLLEPTSTNLQIHENPRKGLFVENLKEVEVHNVGDIMDLLLQGAANRRVAQTRMNQESSRSHSVFTCVIESQWITDSVTSFRYGRLNLVDLAGSERQKTSGAEGERLREAANINKSLSTLGLVIMILADMAQGKQRHVPYRDSKLTFLLQDSLGGNSKTAIIATVSPAIACANETLSTLKFAQRAKFIQNNAVINEDACGDVKVLQSQIQDLKKELEKLRDQRQLSKNSPPMVIKKTKMIHGGEQAETKAAVTPPGSKVLEEIQTGIATEKEEFGRDQELLQEKNELAAENQQLNLLIQAYERDLNYVKTMLQLREDKFQRLEKVEDLLMSADVYLQEENRFLRQELLLLKDRMNNHPELLRFALENKHLIQQLRRHDELNELESEMQIVEPASLRHQALNSIQSNLTEVKLGNQMMSSTQNTVHENKVNQPSHFQSLIPKENLMTRANCQGKNDITKEGALTDLVSSLEEGNQALNEALQEVKSIEESHCTESENWLTNVSQGNTLHGRHTAVNYSLQQLYDIAKNVEDCFEVLCNVLVGENKQTKSGSLKVLLPTWGKRKTKVKPDLTNIIHASDYCKSTIIYASDYRKNNQQCSAAQQMIEEGLLSGDDCGSKSGSQSGEAISDGAFTSLKHSFCLPLRSESQKSNSKDFFCNVAECGAPHEILVKQASLAKPKHEVKQEVCLNFASRIQIALAMMQESFDTKIQRGPTEDLTSEVKEWKQAFEDDACQTCMEDLNHEKILKELQKQLAEIHHMLNDEDIRFDALCSLATKMKVREKRWLSEKTNLKHQLLRLQSDAAAKDKEIAALQNEEAILAAIVQKLHKGEERMREELINLKHQLEYSENQRLLAEQMYNTKDQIKVSPKLQKLVTEVHNNKCMVMTVKKLKEIDVASLREAEISKKNTIGRNRVDPVGGEIGKAHQSGDIQKQHMVTETDMTSMLARLQEAECSWKEEKGMILLELETKKLYVAEKIGDASDDFERFKHGQEIIREAELVVNALTKANEDAKLQKLNLMHQWHQERESMATKIRELESFIVQKEEELQIKEQEVQQMISRRETIMLLAHERTNTKVPDGEEGRNMTADLLKSGDDIDHISSSKQEPLTTIFQPHNQLYALQPNASVLANAFDISRARIPAEKLDSNYLALRDINVGWVQDNIRKENQEQIPAMEIGLLPFQNKQLKHEEAQVTADLYDPFKEVVMLKSQREKSSRYKALQTQDSHAATTLMLQEKESELEKQTWFQEAGCQEHETGEALRNFEKANSAQTSLQNITLQIVPALQSYDESTSLLLEKLEGIVATISEKAGREDAWVYFLNSLKHALSKLEEDANSCLNFSNCICEKLDKTLAEKQSLEEELERKKELLKGSFFDLSLLQENIAEYIDIKSEIDGAFSFIRSLQEELAMKKQSLREKEVEYANLEHEKRKETNRLLFLETSLSEAQKHATSMAKENADTSQRLEDALRKIKSMEASLEEKERTIEKLEEELLDVNLLAEQRFTQMLHSVKQELSLTKAEKDRLQTRLVTLEEQLDSTRLAAEQNKRLADEAQRIAETSNFHIHAKETEVKILEKSTHELEDTINVLENQVEILKREMEIQQLNREDLEMDLQALRQLQYLSSSSEKDSKDTKGQQEQMEIMNLRKEITDKSAQIEGLKLQLEELISAAEKQAAAHYRNVVSLEVMADSPIYERRQASPKTRKTGDRNFGKYPTSPFKCLSSGLAQQIDFEMDEELYSNRCRINELEDLAASRQKEIFRLNKKLADAETMTYDVIRDLLGVKSDIATHASYVDQKELVKFSKMASHHTRKAIHKEKELEALRDLYNEEKERWMEDTARRQAEVVAALIAVEKLRHKDFLLKAENKRLKTDLSRQKKRLLQLQDKLNASSGQEKYHHHICDIQNNDELRLNHLNESPRSRTKNFER